MFHMHRHVLHALGLLSLGVVLAGCQPPDTTPTSALVVTEPSAIVAIPTAAQPSLHVASPTMVLATAVPLSTIQSRITASPIVTEQPTPLPTLTAITNGIAPTLPPPAPPPFVRTADRLPADQPWVLVDDGTHVCGESAFDQSLIAIDHTGGWTRLNRRVTTYAKRPGLPPLLATCTAAGTTAIVDPMRWTSVRLALEPGFFINQLVVSPDQKQAVFCHSVYECRYSAPAFQHGAVAPFSSGRPGGDGPFGMLAGWGHNGLYYAFAYDIPRSTIVLFVGDPAHPANSQFLGRDFLYTVDSAHDRLLHILHNPPPAFINFSYGDLIRSDGLLLSDLRKGTTQTIEQAAWVTTPTFAPDGMAITYFRAIRANATDVSPPAQRDLVVVDLVQNTKTILTHTLTFPLINGTPTEATLWSQDGQRIIIGTQSPHGARQVAVLTRDGALLNTVSLPELKFPTWGITRDDQLLLYWNDGQGVSWLPLRAGDAPYAPDMLMSGRITAVILPSMRSDTPAPIGPTSAAPLPVTQLPAPTISTPTPT